LLNVRYERCEGPGHDGCHACIGGAEAPLLSGAVANLARGIDRRLPPVMRQAGRQLATALVPQRFGEAETGRRLDHMRAICAGVSRFVAPSEHIRQRFVQFGIPQDRITLSPYGLDRRLFAGAAHTPARPIRLGFMGTLMASKAPHLLLEAHRRLPSGSSAVTLCGAVADYHGDTSYRRLLEPLLAGAGVRMTGALPHDEIPRVMASIDVLVVPSIWEENSPFVIWEAMLAGVLVVASRVGGIPEIVEHGRNGLLFEPGSVDDLERTLRRLLDDPELCGQLKAGALATPVRTIENDVQSTRAMYASLIAQEPQPRRQPRLSAIVLNYRTTDDTLLAVASQLASNRRPDEVIVVDNDVEDECRAPLARYGDRGRRIRYLHTGRNLGFSGGMNAGIREALKSGSDQILLVNADVVVPPDCIGRLQDALARQKTGIVGPIVRSRSFPDVIGSAGIDYSLGTGRMRHRAFGARVGRPGNGGPLVDDGPRDAVSGCAMLISREVFEQIGLFDERFFFSFEEIDFCLRARQAGFETRLVASASVYHAGSRAIGPESTRRFYFAARNHLLLASLMASGQPLWTRGRIATWVAALNIAHAMTARGGSLAGRLAATSRGMRDHLSSRYGSDEPGVESP
jgi:GT2 family glycosyltransferase